MDIVYLPYIVLVVDEFADLIMTAGKEVRIQSLDLRNWQGPLEYTLSSLHSVHQSISLREQSRPISLRG